MAFNRPRNRAGKSTIVPVYPNLLVNSALVGGGSIPTSWANGGLTGLSAPNGTHPDGSVIYRATAVAERPRIFQGGFVLAAFGSYVASATVDNIYSGSQSLANFASWGGAPTGSVTAWYKNGVLQANGNGNIATGDRISVTIVAGATGGTISAIFGGGVSSNATIDLDWSRPSLHAGTTIRPYVKT